MLTLALCATPLIITTKSAALSVAASMDSLKLSRKSKLATFVLPEALTPVVVPRAIEFSVGAVVSSVKLRLLLAVPTLPATSVMRLLSALAPSAPRSALRTVKST